MQEKIERRSEMEPSLDWTQSVTEAISYTFENLELYDFQINFDPATILGDKDSRMLDELSEAERRWINREVFRIYSIRLENCVKKYEYQFSSPEGASWKGVAKVRVLDTPRSSLENIYLHEITWPGVVEPGYMIAGKDFRL